MLILQTGVLWERVGPGPRQFGVGVDLGRVHCFVLGDGGEGLHEGRVDWVNVENAVTLHFRPLVGVAPLGDDLVENFPLQLVLGPHLK